MHRDYVEMLSALCAAEAEFPIVGAHAMAAHDQARATLDLDIWVRATPINAERVWRSQGGKPMALSHFARAALAALYHCRRKATLRRSECFET